MVRSRHPEDEGEILAGRPLVGGEDAGPVAPAADPFCPTRASSLKPEFDPLAGMGLAVAAASSSLFLNSVYARKPVCECAGQPWGAIARSAAAPVSGSTNGRSRRDGPPARAPIGRRPRRNAVGPGIGTPGKPRRQTRLRRPPSVSAADDLRPVMKPGKPSAL
jgi:hypothetical protein